MKVVLVLLGFFALLAVLAVGSIFYIGYRVKQKAEMVKKEANDSGIGGLLESISKSGTPSERGSASHADSARRRSDPCSLLTKEEVGQALGSPIRKVANIGGNCEYTADEVKISGSAATFDNSVQVAVEWGDAAEKMKFVIGGTKLALGYIGGREAANQVIQPFTGIGDEAYYGAGILQFRKNDAFVKIDVSHAHVRDRRALAEALAQKVLARL